MAGAALTWLDPPVIYGYLPDVYATTVAAVLLVGGALLVWLAYARRREEVPVRAWKLVGVVAAATLASWLLPIIGRSVDALGLHQAAREWPSTILLPLALAGAMMWSPRKALRVASAVAVIASATAAGIGSQTFLDLFCRDLFLVPATNLELRTLNDPVKRVHRPVHDQ